MNRSKKLYILLGLLLAVSAATFAVTRIEERREQIRNSGERILELPAGSVQSLSWEHEGTSLAFHRDGTWLYDGDEAFPVSEERMQSLLELFEAFSASFVIENVEDYGQYGLDHPVCTIQLNAGEERFEIKLGDYSKMDSKRYVSIGDGNVYLTPEDPLDLFGVELRDLIDNDKIPDFDQAASVQFSGGENYSLFYNEDGAGSYSADDVYYARQDGKELPLDTYKVDSYLQAIRYLDLTDYVSYQADSAELAACGLDTPELTITVEALSEDGDGRGQPESFVLQISRDPEEKKNAGSAAGNAEDGEEEIITAYARVGDSPIIYNLSSDSYTSLIAASYDDLRHQEVFWADFSDVERIDIALEGETRAITSEKEKDARVYFYQDEELEIESLQSALEALCADSFTREKPSQKEEISLTVYLDNENVPQVSIKLYRYDGTHCLAMVDGQPVSLVPRAVVVDLIEAVHSIVLR